MNHGAILNKFYCIFYFHVLYTKIYLCISITSKCKTFFYFDNIHNVFFLFVPLTSSEIHGHELTDMQDWPWVSKYVSKKVKCFLNKFYII